MDSGMRVHEYRHLLAPPEASAHSSHSPYGIGGGGKGEGGEGRLGRKSPSRPWLAFLQRRGPFRGSASDEILPIGR